MSSIKLNGNKSECTYKNKGIFLESRRNCFKDLVKMVDPDHDYNTRSSVKNFLIQPNCQTSLDLDKVKEIEKSYMEQPETWEFRKNIVVGIINGKKYIVDGQHRLNAFRNLWIKHKKNTYQNSNWGKKGDFVIIYYYKLESKKQLEALFKEINKDSIKNQNWIENIPDWKKHNIDLFLDSLKNHLYSKNNDNKTEKYGAPFFAKNKTKNGKLKTILELRDQLIKLDFFKNNGDPKFCLEKLKEYNDIFYEKNSNGYEHFTYVDKEMVSINKKFIVGVKNTNFLDLVLKMEQAKSEDEKNVIIATFKTKHDIKKLVGRKKKIASLIKRKIWYEQYGKEASMIQTCPCCKKNLIEFGTANTHAGHILSEKNGGETTSTNLIPICSTCNGSNEMGILNWDEYLFEKYEIDTLIEREKDAKKTNKSLLVTKKIRELVENYSKSKKENQVEENQVEENQVEENQVEEVNISNHSWSTWNKTN
jgi:hypothetical protein